MAFAKKYTINFKQLKDYDGNDDWTIDIYQEGHGGGVTELYTERNSIVLRRDGGQFEYVNGTKLSFGLYNLTEEQFIEFREATYGDYYCILKRGTGGEQWFKGFNQSEIYTESYSDIPYSAKLEFTCGISHLKYVRFDNSGTLYTGQKSLIEVIRLCLNKLPGSGLQIREFVNMYEDSQNATTSDSILNQTFVDVDLYREQKDGVEVGMTCHKVLNELMKCINAHLFQSVFTWYVVRWQEYSDATMYYREFDPRKGTESTITVDGTGNYTTNKREAGQPDGTSTELVITSDSELSIEPPLNRIRLTYNQNFNGNTNTNLIKNGCMETLIGNNYTGNPSYWNYTGIDPDTYNAIFSINGYNWFEFDDKTVSVYNSSKYIKQTRANLYISTSDTLEISLKGFQLIRIDKAVSQADYNTINNYLHAGWYRHFPIQIKIGSYYLRSLGTNNGDWVTTPTVFYLDALGSGVTMPTFADTFDAQIFNSFVINTAVLPLSGFQDIEMTFFRPYSNVEPQDALLTDFNIAIQNFGIRCASVIYKPDTSAAITDYVVYQEIDEDEDVLELDLMHGDGLYDFSVNSFRLSDGSVTNNWNRRGKTDNKTIFEQILVQYKELRGAFVKNISGKLIGQFYPYNTVEHTVNGTPYHYMIKDYTYNVETNEWDCNLMEIADNTAITPDITTTYRLVEGSQETEIVPDTPNEPNTMIIADSSTVNNQYLNDFI